MGAKVELLAPAGSQLALKAALLAGADAVYLGGKKFGARSFAENFDESGLKWARRVTNSLGKRLYITLNTLVFDDEFSRIDEILDFYEALQPDALILQDIGLILYLKKRGSTIPRHLSTQGAWDGWGGEAFLRGLGISRVILPREQSLDDISRLVKNSGLEVEVFVHGAMCYSVSGRCFWSHALGERSGNRGTCAQPCRKTYSVDRGERGYFFSPKDLRLATRLDELKQVGVRSVKIEGRMKNPDYVFQVVKVYRQLLDERTTDLSKLDEVFSRPHQNGFFDGNVSSDWNTSDSPGKQELKIGAVTGIRNSKGLLEIGSSRKLKAGDGLSWQEEGSKTGARLTFVEAVKGNFLVRGTPDLPIGTDLWLSDVSLRENWLAHWDRKWERQPIELFWSGFDSQPLAVETVYRKKALRLLTDELLSVSLGVGLDEGPIQEKFGNLGETFRVERNVMKALEPKKFVSPAALKKLKRELVEVLLGLEKWEPVVSPGQEFRGDKTGERKIAIRIWNSEIRLERNLNPDIWLIPIAQTNPGWLKGQAVGYWIPPLARIEDRKFVQRILNDLPGQEILCMGWEAFYLAKTFPKHQFRVDWNFNLSNRWALQAVYEFGIVPTIGREWSKEEPMPSGVWKASPWNPLISISRFPAKIECNRIFSNSHGDRFFLMEIASGFVGTFFITPSEAWFHQIPQGNIQIDFAPSPEEHLPWVQDSLENTINRIRAAR